MPPKRHLPSLKAAASLPASRLPLGTPTFPTTGDSQTSTSHTPSREAPKHLRHQDETTTDASDSDRSATTSRHPQLTHHPSVMSAQPGGSELASSIAAAKLERQRRRIEEADAALANPLPPSEKPRQISKGKARPSWKRFDFAPEDPPGDPHGTGPPAVESRVNVFRAPSQGGMMSRPMSRLSSHTYDSMASESDRAQPSFLEQVEFQIYTGRSKARRPYPFEEKPNQQQTVEAIFSKREVSDVFGNELPGPSFMDGNPGATDGLVQFIQHPNGDISAQQWSASRYEWENIGQFSNIRKKVEGQLAAHRLKGETAAQAKQQNTLAYFRIIAKQREADIMGLPFSQKDITAALPDARPPSTAPTGPKKLMSSVQMPARPISRAAHGESEPRDINVRDEIPSNVTVRAQAAQHQQPQQTARLNPALNFTPLPRMNVGDDPFITPAQYRSAYDYANFTQQHHHVHHYGMQMPLFLPNPVRFPQYSPYPAPQTYASVRNYNSTFPYHDRASFEEQYERLRLQEQTQQAPAFTSEPSLHHPMPHHTRSSSITKHQGVAVPKTQTRLSTPQETREAMRDHVMQMSQQAKERNKSLANIARTVAHDPLLNQRSSPTPEPKEAVRSASPVPSELTGSTYVDRFGISTNTRASLPPSLAPAIALPFDTASTTASENNLRDSSPDRDWQRRNTGNYVDNFPNARRIDFDDEPKKWDPSKLDEWWWSGTKFARHEQFFSSVLAADSPSKPRLSTNLTSLTSRSPPIGPPSSGKDKAGPEYNAKATRVLIPVLENLASYAPGPAQKRDYFSPWTKAPEWAIDRSEKGNESFFDNCWGEPPKRVGMDARYNGVEMPRRFGDGSGTGGVGGTASGFVGIDKRFGYGGVFGSDEEGEVIAFGSLRSIAFSGI